MPPKRTDPLERLKIAFAMYVCRRIVKADEVVHPAEVEHLATLFPLSLLEDLGFVRSGESTLTPEFHRACHEAREKLPTLLTIPEREGLVRWFRQVCYADGVIDDREADLVEQAQAFLELTDD